VCTCLSLTHTHTHTHTHTCARAFSAVLVQLIPNTGLEPGLVTDVGYKLHIIAHFISLLRGLWWSEVWQEEYCPLHDVTTEERKFYRVRRTLRSQCRSGDSDGFTGCTAEKSRFKFHYRKENFFLSKTSVPHFELLLSFRGICGTVLKFVYTYLLTPWIRVLLENRF
jgi:hypothetical protein